MNQRQHEVQQTKRFADCFEGCGSWRAVPMFHDGSVFLTAT
jgi:hypothetical protein